MDNKYNGWSNYETWNVGLWFGDVFNDIAEDNPDMDGDYLRTFIDGYLEENMNEQSGLIADIVNSFVARVNWDELADHYRVHEPEEEMEDA